MCTQQPLAQGNDFENANMRTKQSKITGMSGFASPQQRNNTHSVNLNNVFIQNP